MRNKEFCVEQMQDKVLCVEKTVKYYRQTGEILCGLNQQQQK